MDDFRSITATRDIKYKLYNKLFYFTAILSSLTALWVSLLAMNKGLDKVVDKKPVISSLSTAIKNGCDLQVIKTIYSNREFKSKGIKELLGKGEQTYEIDEPLSKVLEDIKSDLFLNGPLDTTFLIRLDELMIANLQTNPFDNLEPNQRDLFINIRQKVPDKYSIIQEDLNKISTELNSKNTATVKYLKYSNMSLIFSLTGLMLALILGFIQIYQNRSSKLIQIIDQCLRKHTKEMVK